MNENIIYSIILFFVGIFGLFRAIKFLRNPKFAREYIEKSPKAKIWKKMFGVDKATKITRNIFVPLAIIMCVGAIIAAIILIII